MKYLMKYACGVALILSVSGCGTGAGAAANGPQPHASDAPVAEPVGAPGEVPVVGEVSTPCLPVASTSVAMDEVSELGFAPEVVAAHVAGTFLTTVEWADGERTNAELEVALLSEQADVIEFELNPSDDGPLIEIGCAGHMELPVQINLRSEDARLGQGWTATVVANTADLASATMELERAAFEATLVTLGAPTSEQLTLHVQFSEAGASGQITAIASTTSGSGSDATVSVERFTVANF